MLNFLSLIVYMQIMELLKDEYTVEQTLIQMGNLMCSVYNDMIIVSEPAKKMKDIAELLGIMVPKSLGV